MKDALGHGSNTRGGTGDKQFDAALNDYAAHQHGILSAVPNADGRALYDALTAHLAGKPRESDYSATDLRGMALDEQDGAEFGYPEYTRRQ